MLNLVPRTFLKTLLRGVDTKLKQEVESKCKRTNYGFDHMSRPGNEKYTTSCEPLVSHVFLLGWWRRCWGLRGGATNRVRSRG